MYDARMRLLSCFAIIGLVALSSGCRSKDTTSTTSASTTSTGPASLATTQAIASALGSDVPLTARVTGNIHSVGGGLGTWDTTLDNCSSGETEGFYGADFSAPGSTDLRLRYVHDEAKGEVVKIIYPNKKDTAFVISKDDRCAVLEGFVQKENMTVWTPKGRIRYVKGHVKFDCKVEGNHVTGDITFESCH